MLVYKKLQTTISKNCRAQITTFNKPSSFINNFVQSIRNDQIHQDESFTSKVQNLKIYSI